MYVTYKAGNTAIKAGRQALPSSLSPWAWTDSSLAGRKDNTFNGVVLVNTDLADTTLAAAWIASYTDGATTTKINGSNKGLFMLAAEYKGVANTTLDASVYYIPKNGAKGKAFSAWTSAKTKVSSVDLGLQVAYAKADASSVAQKGAGTKATIGIAAYAGTKFDAFSAKLTLGYLNAGNASLNLGGTSAFWGGPVGGSFGTNIDTAAGKQKTVNLSLGYKVPNAGKIYFDAGADKPDNGKKIIGARVGYKFKVAGVKAKVEYRYIKNKGFKAGKNQRIRLQGEYKF